MNIVFSEEENQIIVVGVLLLPPRDTYFNLNSSAESLPSVCPDNKTSGRKAGCQIKPIL
ncbi:MAG: hypothetical protein GX640_19825 [Fibrobacter sp.]|nr:hypothetical protein [Fibrobacter sp.]